MRTPKVRSGGGRALWTDVALGALPLTSTSYTREGRGLERDSCIGRDDPAVLHARFRQPFALPSGTAGTNLRQAARYAWENCDPLQNAARSERCEGPTSGDPVRPNLRVPQNSCRRLQSSNDCCCRGPEGSLQASVAEGSSPSDGRARRLSAPGEVQRRISSLRRRTRSSRCFLVEPPSTSTSGGIISC